MNLYEKISEFRKREGLADVKQSTYYLYVIDTVDVITAGDKQLAKIFLQIYTLDGLAKKTIDIPLNDAFNYRFTVLSSTADYNAKFPWLKNFIKEAMLSAHITGGALILKYVPGADYSDSLPPSDELIKVDRRYIHKTHNLAENDYTVDQINRFVKGAKISKELHPDNYIIVPGDFNIDDKLGSSFFKKGYNALKFASKHIMNTSKSVDLNNTVFVKKPGARQARDPKELNEALNMATQVYNAGSMFVTDSTTSAVLQHASLGAYKDLMQEAYRGVASAMNIPLQILQESNTDTAKSGNSEIEVSSYEKSLKSLKTDKILPLFKQALILLGVNDPEVEVEEKYSYQMKDNMAMLKGIGDMLPNIETPEIKRKLEERVSAMIDVIGL